MASDRDSFSSRTWTIIFYQEHFKSDQLPDNIKSLIDKNIPIQNIIADLINSAHLGKGYVSPLHDPDQEEDSDHIRKAHYHVMIKYPSKQYAAKVHSDLIAVFPEDFFRMDIRDSLDNSSRVRNWSSVARYLIHKDNPEKQQFEAGAASIVEFGGCDIFKDIVNDSEISIIVDDMKKFISDNDITDYDEFDDYCLLNRPDWSRVLNVNNPAASAIWRKIKAKLYSKERDIKKQDKQLAQYHTQLAEKQKIITELQKRIKELEK